MKRLLFIFYLFITFASYAKNNDIVLYNGNIVDTQTGVILYNKTIVIRDGDIIKITDSNKKIKKGQRDVSGRYVLPGLIDSHTHWGSFGYDSTQLAHWAKEYLEQGITTVRDMGGNVLNDIKYREYLKQGVMRGPQVFYCSFWAGEGYTLQDSDTDGWKGIGPAPWSRIIEMNYGNIEQAVIDAKNFGCLGFKIYVYYNKEDLDYMVPLMKKHGMKVWAHTSLFDATALDVVTSGVEVVSHAYLFYEYLDKTPLSDSNKVYRAHVFKEMVKRGVVLDPTALISISNGDKAVSEVIKEAYKAGVKFVVGTDYYLVDKKDSSMKCAMFKEMEILNDECGLTVPFILKAATYNGAEILGFKDKLGIIKEGARADILILQQNPLESLKALEKIDLMLLNGKEVIR